jgi:hypothetical protein
MVNKSRKCPQCQLVSFADAEVCKRCGASLTTKKIPRALISPRAWVGIIAGVVIVCTFGLVIWALVFTQSSRPNASQKVFASRAEQLEWLVTETSTEQCNALEEKLNALSAYETPSEDDKAQRYVCAMKIIKVQNPVLWEDTLKQLRSQPVNNPSR